MSDFKEYSKKVANDFLQSIVFIDDMAFEPFHDAERTDGALAKNIHPFSANDVSKAFAKVGKLCAVYAPRDKSDLDYYKSVLVKADVVVLDWNLNLAERVENVDSESDVENEDPRGEFTLSLLDEIVEASFNDSLHLVVIYTGEIDVSGIADKIQDHFEAKNLQLERKGDSCDLSAKNIKILVRAKECQNYKFLPELKDKVVSYEELPDLVLNAFTVMTKGLLSNYALWSITKIRNKTPRILSLYSPHLDSAYLAHKLSLEDFEASKQLLRRLFGDTIVELLESEDFDTQCWIDSWLDSFFKEINNNSGSKNALEVLRDSEKLKKVFRFKGMVKKTDQAFKEKIESVFKDDANSWQGLKSLGKNANTISQLFDCGGDKINQSNLDFAKLTHYKNLLEPRATPPVLSLGVVVRLVVKKDGDDSVDKFLPKESSEYFVCIQQRCDSVRIGSEEPRRFLFLPLRKGGGKNKLNVIINEEVFSADTHSYSLKTMKFCLKSENDVNLEAEKDDEGFWCFTSIRDEKLIWCLDLKEVHALRIVHAYSSQLSRIGLDESEWLRTFEAKE